MSAPAKSVDRPKACQHCSNPAHVRGLCRKHYMRRYRAEQTPTAKPTPLTALRQGLAQLIATWRDRASARHTLARAAFADGRDGEAFRLEQEAVWYEQAAAEAARLEEAGYD